MSTYKDSTKAEEVIFYLDLVTNFLKKKNLVKGIKSFITSKNTYNFPRRISGSYGIVLFQGEGNPITIYDTQDEKLILNTINETWDSREVKQSYFENGIFEILSYIFKKIREIPKIYRVIIISDDPSKLSEDYYNAAYDLIIKAKVLGNIFVDIIRVGDERFYSDDIKLKVITNETRGGTFYCKENNHFLNILDSLIKSKMEYNVIQEEKEKSQIIKKDKNFFERMAVDLITLSSEEEKKCALCGQELCPICNLESDEVLKCYNCSTKFHHCCAAKYSISNNIGFNHIFHCPNCESLLKLDEELVQMIWEEEQEEALQEIEIIESSIENEVVEKIAEQPPDTEKEPKDIQDTQLKKKAFKTPEKPVKIRVGGYFGKDIVIEPNNFGIEKDPQMSEEDIIDEVSNEQQPKEKISITSLKPPRKRTIKLCKICGTFVKDANICPNCGASID
ncbi:MAG: hypothetical protein ACTSUT_17725 [Promethearchaeota archaeon]